MSEDFLKNPLLLFDVKGKTAIVTGATGAFGCDCGKDARGGRPNVVITANNAEATRVFIWLVAISLQIEIFDRQTEIGLGDAGRSEIWLVHRIVSIGRKVAEETLHGFAISDARRT